MKKKELVYRCQKWHLNYIIAYIIVTLYSYSQTFAQDQGEITACELAATGFENIRWTETEKERIYTLENNIYKIQTIGIKKAIEIIEKNGLPTNKRCRIIITQYDVPKISLTHEAIQNTTNETNRSWNASYELDNSWIAVKGVKKKNSSRYKVDLLVYPQLSFQNMDITKIYQVMFTLNPALEVSLWPGMKMTGQVILPLIVDTEGYAAYTQIYKKVRPGFLTMSQRFRLPYNIESRAVVGIFSNDQYGVDLEIFKPFKDERFSLEGRIGYTGWGYWDGFKFHYNDQYQWSWSIGCNFYWPKYDVQFSLKGEQYLLGEKGVRFDMKRHFRYTSIGFYAMKAEHAKSNGGFYFQIALPPYKQKRHKFIPRISTSRNMGLMYNAGNERIYYKQYRSEPSENIMEQNRFNPIYIENNLFN